MNRTQALREAQALVATGAAGIGQDCTSITTVCPIPDAVTGNVAGCPTCWTNATPADAGDLAPRTAEEHHVPNRNQTGRALDQVVRVLDGVSKA